MSFAKKKKDFTKAVPIYLVRTPVTALLDCCLRDLLVCYLTVDPRLQLFGGWGGGGWEEGEQGLLFEGYKAMLVCCRAC